MGDVVGRNKLHVVGYRDLYQWAEEIARETGYPCEAVDEPVLLGDPWLNLHGVPCVPARAAAPACLAQPQG